MVFEVKGTTNIEKKELLPSRVFNEEFAPKSSMVVANVREEKIVDKNRIIPYRRF